MFFKRRSRANSYLEESDSPQSKTFEKYERPPSSRRDSAPTVNGTHESIAPIEKETQMYPRQNGPQETFVPQRQMTTGHNAMPPMDPSHGGMGMPMSGGMHMKPDPIGAPDLLTRAFNEAVRPYTDKIDQLESQVAELNAWIETLEQQRAEVHSWIDKRGLRPGKTPHPNKKQLLFMRTKQPPRCSSQYREANGSRRSGCRRNPQRAA